MASQNAPCAEEMPNMPSDELEHGPTGNGEMREMLPRMAAPDRYPNAKMPKMQDKEVERDTGRARGKSDPSGAAYGDLSEVLPRVAIEDRRTETVPEMQGAP